MRLARTIALVTTAMLQPMLAQAAEIEEGMCYAASYAREKGPVREFTLRLGSYQDGDTKRSLASMAFSQWDVPNQVFDTSAGCSDLGGGAMRCSVDCDGGNAILRMVEDGRLLVQTSHLRIGLVGEPSTLATEDMGSGVESLFVLTPRPGDETCAPKSDGAYAELAPGDISRRVGLAETMLGKLGDFLYYPDTVYDEATAEAVRRFQQRQGLPANGVIDASTAKQLTQAANAFGGC